MPYHLDPADVEAVLAKAERDQVKFVNLQFTDIAGHVKTVTEPVVQLADSLNFGTWFDGSSIEGFARIHESDMFLVPDPATYALVPWEYENGQVARFICDTYNPDGSPMAISPRWALKRALEHARELGFEFYTGPELEFFLLNKENGQIHPSPHDEGGYFDYSTDEGTDVRNAMINALEPFGIVVETSHHEVALGQHEIDFEYGKALTTADNATTFKYALKAVAQQNGLHATFMPKPIEGENGSGMHTHQSLFTADGENAFYDANDPLGLSKLARQFLAGQLAHARDFCSVIAPLVNSYKRLVPGYEAPVYIGWGRTNRSALIRIPRINPERPKATRVELRCPDPSCDPYLAFAVMLEAGLDGIERDLQLPPEAVESFYEMSSVDESDSILGVLPYSLGGAIEATEESDLVRNALGEPLFNAFITSRKQEWASYLTSVSQWEMDRYLSVY